MSKPGRKGGSVPWNKGIPMTEESKQKISLSKKGNSPAWNKGMEMPEVAKRMLGNQNGQGGKGKKISDESKYKMRLAKLGRPSGRKGMKFPPEWIEKIAIAKKGKVHTPQAREANRQGQYRRYLKINPEYKVATRNRRIAENGGFHSEKEWEKLKAQYNWTCPCCKRKEPEIKLTRDHILPLLLKGKNDITNIQPLCTQCNIKKHIQIVKY